MTFSDRTIDVMFGDHEVEKLISSLQFGDKVSASALLTAMDGETEDVLEETLEHLVDYMEIALDISDLPAYVADADTAMRLRREEQLVKQGNLLQNLEETDPLRLYLEELAAIPVCGDVAVLTDELCRVNRDECEIAPVREKVMHLCLSRVVELAQEFVGRGVLLMDLIQEGSMGLWRVLHNFIDNQGDNFEQCRDWSIRQYMARAVVKQYHAAGVGQKLRQAMEDYRAVDEKLLTELGRNPTVEEIAEALHMTVQETAVVADMLENARMLQRAKQPEPEQLPQEEDQAVEDTAYFQMRQRIAELLSVLSEEDAKLLTLRYGLENGRPMTPQQAGQALGMTPEEVNQKEAAALAKLRKEN